MHMLLAVQRMMADLSGSLRIASKNMRKMDVRAVQYSQLPHCHIAWNVQLTS